MKRKLAMNVVDKIRWEIRKQEMFLMRVQRIQALPDAERAEIVKDCCWVDGTLGGQVQYALQRRLRLWRAYDKIYTKWINK